MRVDIHFAIFFFRRAFLPVYNKLSSHFATETQRAKRGPSSAVRQICLRERVERVKATGIESSPPGAYKFFPIVVREEKREGESNSHGLCLGMISFPSRLLKRRRSRSLGARKCRETKVTAARRDVPAEADGELRLASIASTSFLILLFIPATVTLSFSRSVNVR